MAQPIYSCFFWLITAAGSRLFILYLWFVCSRWFLILAAMLNHQSKKTVCFSIVPPLNKQRKVVMGMIWLGCCFLHKAVFSQGKNNILKTPVLEHEHERSLATYVHFFKFDLLLNMFLCRCLYLCRANRDCMHTGYMKKLYKVFWWTVFVGKSYI